MPRFHTALFVALASINMLLVVVSPVKADQHSVITYRQDVMAVLSKAGCNAGTCHGNINGKGGLFLSLRGQDPQFDFQQLVYKERGRRIDRFAPEDSLLLRKATGQTAHEGGKRFGDKSLEYQILRDWIASGAAPPESDLPTVVRLDVTPADQVLWLPEKQVPLQVIAHFSDGEARDVTRLAVYEPSDPLVKIDVEGVVHFDSPRQTTILVRYLDAKFPVRLALRSVPEQFTWQSPPANNLVDQWIHRRLLQLKLNPAPLAEDAVFLRRLSLDLLGILPTAEEARAFIADTSPDKRERLVDAMLAKPEFALMWAQKWSDLLRNEEKTLDAKGVELLHRWLTEQFANDVPLNEIARQLIAARGSTYENPPANYWRAHRDPAIRAETTAQVFLGVRLQCAKCHNHPFDRWSQDEYYQWSSLFAGVDYEIVKNERRDDLDKHEFVGDQIVLFKPDQRVKNPSSDEQAAAKFLGDPAVIDGDTLEELAGWISSPDNRMFAEAQTNRVWYHLMGVGLVEPVDDVRATNPASHPELLDALTDHFIANDFSLKRLVRLIVLSQTYQAAAVADDWTVAENELDPRWFASAVIHRLTAEQILDAQSHVLGLPASFAGYETGTRALEIAGVERERRKLSQGDDFLRQFGKPIRLLACECERNNDATLGQSLSLISGEELHRRLESDNNRIGKLLDSGRSYEEIVDELYWTALTRPPAAIERAHILQLIEETNDARTVLEDLAWALLNAKELIFRN